MFPLAGARDILASGVELLVVNHSSTGASDDLVRAAIIARSMVARYGMNEDLGHVSHDSERVSFLAIV